MHFSFIFLKVLVTGSQKSLIYGPVFSVQYLEFMRSETGCLPFTSSVRNNRSKSAAVVSFVKKQNSTE